MTQETSTAKAELLCSFFNFQSGIFQNALLDLTNDMAMQRPTENSNHINWLLGHIVHCRYMLANRIGIEVENPLGTTYWDAISQRDYPTVEKVAQHLPSISSMLLDKLSNITDAELDAKPAPDQPSTGDMVSFFVYHEAYHLGQIGSVRKLIGLEPLKSR